MFRSDRRDGIMATESFPYIINFNFEIEYPRNTKCYRDIWCDIKLCQAEAIRKRNMLAISYVSLKLTYLLLFLSYVRLTKMTSTITLNANNLRTVNDIDAQFVTGSTQSNTTYFV